MGIGNVMFKKGDKISGLLIDDTALKLTRNFKVGDSKVYVEDFNGVEVELDVTDNMRKEK